MNKKLVVYPDSILKTKASPIKKITKSVFKIVEEMIGLMLENNGAGLAAPQIGESLQLIVWLRQKDEEEADVMFLANPVIIERSEELEEDWEGCLSIPGMRGRVVRSQSIKVEGLDSSNQTGVIEATGFEARVIQHEVDHINGILITDRVTPGTEEYGVASAEKMLLKIKTGG